jgi:hypothetical protein
LHPLEFPAAEAGEHGDLIGQAVRRAGRGQQAGKLLGGQGAAAVAPPLLADLHGLDFVDGVPLQPGHLAAPFEEGVELRLVAVLGAGRLALTGHAGEVEAERVGRDRLEGGPPAFLDDLLEDAG